MSIHAAPLTVECRDLTGETLRFDGHVGTAVVPMDGTRGSPGPNPVHLMMLALAACTGMDVISILCKKRMELTGYEVVVSGERREEHPKVFTSIEVVHRVRGRGVSLAAVEEAVRLSHDKYCTVSAQLSAGVEIANRVEIIEE